MAYIIDVLTLTAILMIAVHGYMLIKGLGGMLHLGHAVFYGLGAYGAAIAGTRLLPAAGFPVMLLAGISLAALGGALVAWPALRNRGRYFMIVTFAVQLIFVTLVINLPVTGGPDGISSVPGPAFGSWLSSRTGLNLGSVVISYPQVKLAVMVGFAALSFWFCHTLIQSPYGRLVRAVREDEVAVEAYGRDTMPIKASILVIGAGLTGLAGALFASHFNYVGPTQFELDATVLFLVMLIVGGQYSLLGASVGAVLIMALLELLRILLDNVLGVPFDMTAHLRQVFFAVALISVLAIRSTGLIAERSPRYALPTRRAGEAGETIPPTAPGVHTRVPAQPRSTTGSRADQQSAPALTCSGLRKSFGGVTAVADASLDLFDGKIVAIIGPNGAGKTSTFNILSGVEQSDSGTASIGGTSIIGRTAAEIARLGLARTFQDVRVWGRLSAIENILAARADQHGATALGWLAHPERSRRDEIENLDAAWQLLERFGLEHHANTPAGQLSYAQRKMLALARIDAFAPRVMLLDEPTSGVDPRRLGTFLEHIRSFAERENRAVCLVEHNMTVVRDLADWVVFMEEGRVIAAGTPADIIGNRDLMRVYLGHRELKVA